MGSLSKSHIHDCGKRDPKLPRTVIVNGERRSERYPSGVTERYVSLQGNVAWLDAEYDEFLSETCTTTTPRVCTISDLSDAQKFTNAPEFSGTISGVHSIDLASGVGKRVPIGE